MKNEDMKAEDGIKPDTLRTLCRECTDSKWLGDVCRAVGGQAVALDFGQEQAKNCILADVDNFSKRVEGQRERWRKRQQEHRAKDGADPDGAGEGENKGNVTAVTVTRVTSECHGDKGDTRDRANVTLYQPTNHPTTLPTTHPTNLPTTEDTEDNTRVRACARASASASVDFNDSSSVQAAVNAFQADFKKAGDAAFYDPRHLAAIICGTITRDFKSLRVWQSYAQRKHEEAVRTEALKMYHELKAGEEVENRGAALNARLGKLADVKKGKVEVEG